MQRIAPSGKPEVTARNHQVWSDACLAFKLSRAILEDVMVACCDAFFAN